MKNKIILLSTIVLSAAVLSLSSCLKDNRFVDFSKVGTIVDFPLGGQGNFGPDAITDPDTVTRQFAVNIGSQSAPTAATKITVTVDNSIIPTYNAANTTVTYLPMPANAYSLPSTVVTVPAGQRSAIFNITFYPKNLDPSLSYMLPIRITDASGLAISGNMNIHYYHVIGNDFAGAYTWDYRRYNNGTGPGPGIIPSQNPTNAGAATSGGTSLGQAGVISPITSTEFQMLTGYNGTGVDYDVSFVRTVSGGVVHYSNWSVKFNATNLAKWTAVGITNYVPPVFTIPPPSTSSDPKIFEMNYVSGGAFPRYIDDTYHK